MRFLIVLSVILSAELFSFAQIKTDTTELHNRKRAALWSGVIPGAGQIYNEIGYRKHSNKRHRAWWKVPIIYGGFGVAGYYFQRNYSQARLLKEEILFRRENTSQTLHPELNVYTTEQQLTENGVISQGVFYPSFSDYARNRDLLIFALGGIWLIQTIEAYVDAHFVTFDVSDKLSLSWNPTYDFSIDRPMLNLRLSF